MYRSLESAEQSALFSWAELNKNIMPELEFMFHIPNGGKRDIRTAVRLKAEGVKPGVPDICLPVPTCKYNGLYIELKVGKNKPTEYQSKWLSALNKHGYHAIVCYGWQDAADEITKYLQQK